MPTSKRTTLLTFILIVAALVGVTGAHAASASTASSTPQASQPYRPYLHYTPTQNWMNDPNGLIYYQGKYHLFYQYNPLGTTGGDASWGHAVSTDLVHWKEQPVAIPMDSTEEVWSGSIVNDATNSSGLGTAANPPLVAVYTSAVKATGVQRQSIAYSIDAGTTWTKYAGNPVLDIGSHNFRDPKVFWFPATHDWRMVVALSDQHKVAIYSSPDLKSWTEKSEFGPDGVTSAVWECPDLFPMNLDGNANDVRWVLSVNVAARAEYFVGAFDGTTFTSQEPTYTPPTGTVLADFEGSTYGPGWTTAGTAFGAGPVHDEGGPTGYLGHGLVDTYAGSDQATGTLVSPAFTIGQPYLNFLIAGGSHPHVPGGSTAAPAGTVLQDFEGSTLPGWTGTGSFVGITPTFENLSGQLGNAVLDTCQAGCDSATGTVTSPAFTVTNRYIDLLVAGGNHPITGSMPTAVNLLVDGQVVASVTGNNSASMDWQAIDAGAYLGKQATIQVVDQSDGSNGWGHIMVDNIVVSDTKAAPWDAQTGANLLVDGQIVRTATGNDSGNLDWTSWDLRDLQGKQAQLQLVDRNTGGWGHLLADQFTLASAPALSTFQRANWLDQGADFYAAVTYNDAPGGKRIAIGWMNNWAYANDIPTSPWRGAQSLPRELNLQTINGHPRIVQHVVDQVSQLADAANTYVSPPRAIPAGLTPLPDRASADVARIDATLSPLNATTFGLVVRRSADGSIGTPITYDTTTGMLSIDRTRSGDVSFNAAFASVQSAPVALEDGALKLEIYLDRSSIEVFAQGGKVALTDLVFPSDSSNGIALTSTGGPSKVTSLTVTPLMPAMWAGDAR